MRKIREVLRLKFEAGLSDSAIARTIGSARSTVHECVRRAREAGLGWPLPADLDEVALQARLYRRDVPLSRSPQPDFARLQAELKRPGVTRLLLWQEYKAAHPDGWQYSVFCDQYRRWLGTCQRQPILSPFRQVKMSPIRLRGSPAPRVSAMCRAAPLCAFLSGDNSLL